MGHFLSRLGSSCRLGRKFRQAARSKFFCNKQLRLETLEDRRLLAADLSTLSSLTVDQESFSDRALIVQFRDGTSSPGSLSAHSATRRLEAEWAITPGMRRVQIDPGSDITSVLAAYRSDPNVVFAEPDFRVSLQLVPDDERFDMLYGLDNQGTNNGVFDADIDATEAWDKTTGSHSTIVAVIDTGVDYTHPDLAANIWTNEGEIPGNGRDDDGNGYIDDIHGYDFVNRDGDPMDDHFHGTHVAGTIGAVGNNGIGITGVAWQVQIMALKFLDAQGGGYTSDAISALNYAVANGAVASNNSWGGGSHSAAFEQALKNAAAKNHIFVAAAGNDGWNNDIDAFYPSGYNVNNIIAVAATDNRDELAWFSNYGVKSVDLAAPGANIYSTFPTRMTDAMRDGGYATNYASISGTSMATPHVTGAIALVSTLHPDWSYVEVLDQIRDTVDVVEGAAKTVTGGRLNVAAAVGNAAPDEFGPRVVTSDPAGAVSGTVSRVRLQFSEPIDIETLGVEDIANFSGPEGPIAIISALPVSGSTRQFDVTFAPQTVLGAYSLVVGPNIADANGNLMDQDRDGTGGEESDDAFTVEFEISDVVGFHSEDVPAPVSWGSRTGSFLEIGQNITISDLNLSLDLSYPYDFDLRISLESPSGTTVMLSYENGGMDADYWGTTFDDEASSSIVSGFAPFTGSFRPEQSLSAFDGENAAGSWTLYVEAWFNSGADGLLWGDGWLEAWSLQINGSGGGGDPNPDPEDPPPGNRAPNANDDELQGEVNVKLGINPSQLLANDTDPDGDSLSVQFVGQPVGGAVAMGNGVITFEPTPDFQGEASFQYIVTDGFLMDIATVRLNIRPLFRWHNASIPEDVNGNGSVTGSDALAIINVINAIGTTPLESLFAAGLEPKEYLDVQADNILKPSDALAVINYINAGFQPLSQSLLSAESPSAGSQDSVVALIASHDAALLSMLAAEAASSSAGSWKRSRGRS